MQRLAITTLVALGILVGTLPLARAADTSCISTIGGTINGNLVVPAGANCTLNNVTVTGNVEVGKGASLSVEPVLGQMVTIGGTVQAARCNAVILNSRGVISVGGNVQIENCTGGIGIRGSGGGGSGGPVTISGNFQCTGNSGNCSAIGGSVRGNVLVDDNTSVGKQGAVVAFNDIGGNVRVDNNVGDLNTDVSGNTIGGNLACAGNTPGVKTDPANTVGGNKQGQCAGP